MEKASSSTLSPVAFNDAPQGPVLPIILFLLPTSGSFLPISH
jgi:hypothetical protein